jgi:multidrug efflux system outer membrane protein
VKQRFAWRLAPAPFLLLAASGCVEDQLSLPLSHPSVAPSAQPAASLKVDASHIRPMYDHRLLAVDLPSVVRVAMARNIDIKEAQQTVEASRGVYESSVGAIFPSLTPNITALGIQGAISSSSGLAVAAFSHLFPAAAIQWIINPGQVAYNVIASKRRLEASEEQDWTVVLETTRAASVQYYDLALKQAQVSVAWQAIKEAEELLRIERLQLKAGTALPADELRAEADLALKQQNLLNAVNGFYNASVALTVTLDLDPTVMLVPRAGVMRQMTLVREDLPIDDMLVTAVRYRPDLEAVRTLLAAADADKGATIWGGLGPQAQAVGVLAPRPPAGSVVDTMYRQPIYNTTGGFNWSAATFGRIKSATANVNIAALNLDRQLDQVQAAVVTAHQASLTAAKLIPKAKQEVASAEEALRLTRENLKVGTGLIVDVLLAEDTADQARLHYATAVISYNQAQINLLAALGLIDPANVEGKPTAAPTLGSQTEPSRSAPK